MSPLTADGVFDEVPLFAAGVEYARHRGGPLTRRFLAALPADWSPERVVVDSTLVWLRPGVTPGEPRWHREAYPREGRGAYRLANGERGVELLACAHGVAPPELLVLNDVPDLPEVCGPDGWDPDAHRRRDAILDGWVRTGRATVRPTRLGEPHAYDGATFVREPPAVEAGFRFWIRATLGSARPLANGLRNTTTLFV